MTGTTEWGLVTQGEGVAGVYSQSDKAPFKTTSFPPMYKAFEGKRTYADWKFSVNLN